MNYSYYVNVFTAFLQPLQGNGKETISSSWLFFSRTSPEAFICIILFLSKFFFYSVRGNNLWVEWIEESYYNNCSSMSFISNEIWLITLKIYGNRAKILLQFNCFKEKNVFLNSIKWKLKQTSNLFHISTAISLSTVERGGGQFAVMGKEQQKSSLFRELIRNCTFCSTGSFFYCGTT